VGKFHPSRGGEPENFFGHLHSCQKTFLLGHNLGSSLERRGKESPTGNISPPYILIKSTSNERSD
jgi:hypothetical protein